MSAGKYTAQIVEVPDHGIKLEPVEGATVPDGPNEVNLLGMSIALALGAAGYHHHAEQRDPELQTLDALLAGDAVMPWKPAESGSTAYIVCELNDGRPTCEVRPTAG
ncbi:hypothetical protein [Kribbella pratensis]|jgi:hypothetical protein|uniref:Uncharacterized protein n=1 Tax=Kribbella pratensis TaxID=2512112 RepID=A0A4R8CNB7_9ACTN|nr:hypothetical protein [Kribbella pratensis]TDW77594.1 hypothetical protein EV653_2764 [Kribbella pratensis]